MLKSRFARKNKEPHSNRLNLIMAIVFLLCLSLIVKLYFIQIKNYEIYNALAIDQHQVFSKLEPERGSILIQDSPEISTQNLYPMAINKEFASVYAVPFEIVNKEETALKLFEIFEQKNAEKEVDEMLQKDAYFSNYENLDAQEILRRNDFKKIKREAEIKVKREEGVNKYVKIFSKKNDPYEPINQKVNEDDLKKLMDLNIPGIEFTMEKHRYYPENNIGSQMMGFVGFNDDQKIGQYGLEGFFNEELAGIPGSILGEKSAKGDLLIINDQKYTKPVPGRDLILTINRAIQFEACQKLKVAVEKHGAEGGSVIVADPKSGAILALCSYPDYDPNNYGSVEDIKVFNNPAIFQQYEPGSIFKSITMAASLDVGAVTPETTYEDKGSVMISGWNKAIKNSDFATHGAHGVVNMVTVLESSLNTGAIFAMQKCGDKVFTDYVKNFGFGEKAGIELEGESSGDIKNLLGKTIKPIEAATASFGQGITTTPLQMVAAYGAIANGGILMKPFIVYEIKKPDGTGEKTTPKQVRRVISERTSLLLSGMLVNVIEKGHAKQAKSDGYYIAGKTGTAQVANPETKEYGVNTIHTFVGFAPVSDPKFVLLTKIDSPKDAQFAESTAVPLFKEISSFIFNYYQLAKDKPNLKTK